MIVYFNTDRDLIKNIVQMIYIDDIFITCWLWEVIEYKLMAPLASSNAKVRESGENAIAKMTYERSMNIRM